MPINLTIERTIEILDALIAERGEDWTYPVGDPDWCMVNTLTKQTTVCQYERNGEGACGVGAVLQRAGVPIERLRAADDEYRQGRGCVTGRDLVVAETGVDLDGLVADFLSAFQGAQDQGHPWGQARDKALAHIGAL